MRNGRLITLIACALAAHVDAAPLTVSVSIAESNVETFDVTTFSSGPFADIYHVELTNPNAAEVTSLELSLRGPWLNLLPGGLALFDDGTPPQIGTTPVAETYFVYPGDAPEAPLAVEVIDTDQLLSASYTFSGDLALIEAGATAVVAVLSLPAGVDPIPGLLPVFGRAVVDGVFECVGYPGDCFPLVQHPEPSTLILVSVALAAVACRRL